MSPVSGQSRRSDREPMTPGVPDKQTFEVSIGVSQRRPLIKRSVSAARNRKLKCSTAWLVRGCPQLSSMRLNNGSAYGESHAHAIWLRGVERLKHPVETRGIEARS